MHSSTTHLVGVAIPTLRELRTAVLSSSDTDGAVAALRDAGYAGGDAVFEAFERWLSEKSGAMNTAADVPVDEFGDTAAEFFRNAGWGDVEFTPEESEGVAYVDITNCWEGGAGGDAGCQLTTGLIASFFGRIAGYPVAVLETECCSGASVRCRFMLGNSGTMRARWEEMQQA
jgi:predicted hydrocarbon binding protein